MTMHYPSLDEKFNTVISKNTFYFQNIEYEEYYEGHISSIAQNIFLLKNRIEREGLKEFVLLEHITEVEDGIDAILTITGFSQESLLRIISFVRDKNEPILSKLMNKDSWTIGQTTSNEFSEWKLSKIKKLIKTNGKFAEGIVNLFFRGSTVPIIKQIIPLFEFKKLDINKFNFSVESLVDTIIRYKTKGAYKAAKENNPETIIEEILTIHKLTFEKGKFAISEAGNIPRTMDFIVPNVVFVGFVDGIGWWVRRGDLKRMVEAYDFVFTFSKDELERFENLLKEIFYGK